MTKNELDEFLMINRETLNLKLHKLKKNLDQTRFGVSVNVDVGMQQIKMEN